MKEFIKIFLVVASGGVLLATTFFIMCFVLFGTGTKIHWDVFVKIAIFCIIGLGIAFLIEKHSSV